MFYKNNFLLEKLKLEICTKEVDWRTKYVILTPRLLSSSQNIVQFAEVCTVTVFITSIFELLLY
jgi:hypothetical protein